MTLLAAAAEFSTALSDTLDHEQDDVSFLIETEMNQRGVWNCHALADVIADLTQRGLIQAPPDCLRPSSLDRDCKVVSFYPQSEPLQCASRNVCIDAHLCKKLN